MIHVIEAPNFTWAEPNAWNFYKVVEMHFVGSTRIKLLFGVWFNSIGTSCFGLAQMRIEFDSTAGVISVSTR